MGCESVKVQSEFVNQPFVKLRGNAMFLWQPNYAEKL